MELNAKSLSIYAVTVWYVDRIGTESSVDFSASRPTTEARADEDSTPLDQYPLSSPARLTDWPFLWPLSVTERKQQCQIIDHSQSIALAALLTLAGIFMVTTPASAESYPACLAGGDNEVRCEYTNLEQCRAAASGGLGYCVINPASVSKAHASYRGAGNRIIDRYRTW